MPALRTSTVSLIADLVIGLHRPGNVHPLPAEGAKEETGTKDYKYQVVITIEEENSRQALPNRAREVADHVHGPADGAGIAPADVRTGRPGWSHAKVIAEEDEAQEKRQGPGLVDVIDAEEGQPCRDGADRAIKPASPFAIARHADNPVREESSQDAAGDAAGQRQAGQKIFRRVRKMAMRLQ